MLLLLLVPVACVCMLLVACGGGKSDTSNAVARAARNTLARGSEHISMHGAVVVGATRIPMTGEGDFRVTPRIGKVTFRLRGVLHATVREVMKDSTIYMNSPLF